MLYLHLETSKVNEDKIEHTFLQREDRNTQTGRNVKN